MVRLSRARFEEGRTRRHGRCARDAVDGLVPKTIGIGADGEVVWSWPPDAEVKRAPLDERCARRGQESPVSGESAE